MESIFIGIDVGTGSARAGLFTASGVALASASYEIETWKYDGHFVEQSSENIWESVCKAVRKAIEQSGIEPEQVAGIGFDATCSLVAVDMAGEAIAVNADGINERNVIVWMDHRAMDQAERINAKGHRVLDYVGGAISPEMQTPKLLWIKENLPACWERSAFFFDLPDYLTYRATGSMDRSLCTTVCKWTYLGHEDHGWNHEYFESIGIDELLDDDYQKIGSTISPPGKALDSGLSEDAAKDFGLPAGIPVGVSMIDAHAGGIGLLGMAAGDEELTSENIDTRLALIGGTSSCHMAASSDAQKVPGVWGPYYSAMVPDFWLTEGGQSATGALVDHIIFSSSRAAELKSHAADEDTTVYELLNRELYRLAGSDEKIPYLTRDLHVLPYFHGNRSPRADASLTGIISGLTLDDSISSLALRYLAAIQAIALGTRHIIDEMNAAGFRISTIMATGGGTKNPVFLQAHADICGCEIILPEEAESVLLGSAMLGAVAAGEYGDLPTAMSTMSRPGEVISPDHSNANYYEGKYRVFLQMYEDQQQYKTIMNKEHAL